MKLILTLVLLFSTSFASAQAMSCGAFTSNKAPNEAEAVLVLTTEDDASKSNADLLTKLDAEFEELSPTGALVDKHLKVLKENEKLRDNKGGFARILTAQRMAKITRLKSALRDGNKERVWASVDQVMLQTEMDAVWLNHQQRTIKALKAELAKPFADSSVQKFRENQLAQAKAKAEKLMVSLHTNYTLYRAFRATFENQIQNGRSDKDKEFAESIFSRTGIDNPALEIELPDSVGIEPGQRPSVDFLRNEYHALNFEDGTERHMANLGLFYKISLENKALKWVKLKSLVKYTAAHKIIDFLSQRLRQITEQYYTSYVLKALDWIAKDLQNQEAMEKHLAEIDSIDSVHASRQYTTFQISLANAKSQGGLRSQDFSFLTSFARAHEYKRTWKRVHLTTALRNVGGLTLVDQILSLQRDMSVQDVALDKILKEIKNKGELLTVDESLLQSETKILEKKQEIENQILEVEKAIAAKIKEFLALENDSTMAVVRPDLKDDIRLYQEMERANNRASNMGPLSYDFSPGTGVRLTSYTIVTAYLGMLAFDKLGGTELLNKILVETIGVSFADFQALIISAEPAVSNLIQSLPGL